ncbi:SRPBCC family protein [Streptomyces sp. PA03-1a]|nr:SRPBCC family protein [Streptomyces sp. PA03-1a]MDX2815166.1 SRPBCC family protein [Streptomyces sp. PA03-5A]
MPTVSTSVIVTRTVEEVFTFLADARNLASWNSGIAAVAADAVPPGERAVYRYHYPGRHREHRLECSVYQPCRRIAYRGRRMWSPLGTQTPEFAFRMLPHSRGAFVQLQVTCQLGGGMLLLSPFLGWAWRRDLPEDARRLREALGDHTVAPPLLPPPPPPPAPVGQLRAAQARAPAGEVVGAVPAPPARGLRRAMGRVAGQGRIGTGS